jgi:dCTP deaminase
MMYSQRSLIATYFEETMLLNFNEICKLLETGVVVSATRELVNPASLDVTLGPTILLETKPTWEDKPGSHIVALRDRKPLNMHEVTIGHDGILIPPGCFFLAHTEQLFNLPLDLAAEYTLKSSMARIGLEHLKAGFCDAGWHGSALTMEFKNVTEHHHIELHVGDRIGQMRFYPHKAVAEADSYRVRGRYNNDKTVSGPKQMRTNAIAGEGGGRGLQ